MINRTIFDIETGPLPEDVIFHNVPHADSDMVKKAALHAVTGQVLAIGYYDGGSMTIDVVGNGKDETSILQGFWDRWRACYEMRQGLSPYSRMVGFRIKSFDFPFIVQRSFINRVSVPRFATIPKEVDSTLVDLADVWDSTGRPSAGYGSLNTICRSLGIGQKPDDCTGESFAAMLLSKDPYQRAAAIRYLRNDLQMTFDLASVVGAV
jgi:uncharacterized protein YprB with RNaseH-like and TPR domain